MKKWIIYPQKSNNIIDQLLANRGIKNKEHFLNPDYERDLYDPFLLKDMNKAVGRVRRAIKNKEKIGLFADYDADGIPGAAILFKVLQFLDSPVDIYIPSREEGYGLNEKGVRELSKNKCKLLITVDLGIVNNKEVEVAKELGMDVIITDHHEIQKNRIPREAVAILHPYLSKKYPNQNLAGGGIAWKLACGVISKLKNRETKKLENYLKWLLDLAAISTICDIVPLVGENRVIVKYGLIVLNKTKNLGLRALYRTAQIEPGTIDPYIVGFWIGPRINAPGRIDHAATSFQLLVTDDSTEARRIAQGLEKINRARQAELERVLAEAKKRIEKRGLSKKKVILIEGKNWPLGIVGLVAGKLMEEYGRPVLVLRQEKGQLKGSARSIEQFSILEALDRARVYLTSHGGHSRAAGLCLESKHLELLYDILLAQAERKLKEKDLTPELKIDAEIKPKEINFRFYDQLKKFEPFGLGNPRPVFLMRQMAISELRTVGSENRHLKLKLITNNQLPLTEFEAIAFGLGHLAENLRIGDKIDLVFTLDEDTWSGRKRLQLKILDFRKSH